MDNFNNNILISNIKKRMEELNYIQKDLVLGTGIEQSTISAVMNGKKGRNFTIEQLWKIANFLKTTPDILLGYNQVSEDCDISLSDFIKAIFNLSRYGKINITKCDKIYYSDDDTKHTEPKQIPCIYFDIPNLCDILTEWQELLNSKFSIVIKSKMILLLHDDILKNNNDRVKSLNYRSIIEHGRYIAQIVLRDYQGKISNSEKPLINKSDNINALEKYRELLGNIELSRTELETIDNFIAHHGMF